MRIPTRLDEKIRELYEVQAWVSGAIADFEPWLKDSKCVFFPDYTDHGNDHVEQILITASSIIRDEAWEVMTPEDAGILVIATLLHDCAMHLTEEGFLRLIKGETHQEAIKDFNDASWKDLWKQFISSAKRLDKKQLQDKFGNTEPVEDPAEKEPDKMTRLDRKVIGEFLRHYHPRLAHEIALLGVPSPDKLKPGEEPLQLPKKLGDDFADIAGLVARSHGMPLRATFEYLKRYDLREYGKVHAVFLMAVLRIADYLQIQAERAPRQTLRVKDIRSSISRREWDVHQSIRGIRSIGDDPEAIFIQTEHGKPDNVNTYLRLKEWLNGIQGELDACWAVFGEVYARTNLQPLGLMLRRVRSNLDNEEQFVKSVKYVPKKVRFEVARNEVLQRLVGPLYENKVEVGIRELIQNSVDAVRELEDSLRNDNSKLQVIKGINLIEELKRIGLLNVEINNDDKEIKNDEQKEDKRKKRIKSFSEIKDADVLVLVQEPEDERKNGKLIVCDRGSGMTEKIITDYFLKVGASLRNSDIWAEQHEDESKNENAERKSRVARSGYFGVGALAAYLLGDKIKVYTRHFNEQIGIEFEARLGDEAIELRYSQRKLPIGTIIEIDITQETLDKLRSDSKYYYIEFIDRWDWYCLDEPKLIRLFIDKNKNFYSLKQNTIIKLKDNNVLTEGWHKIKNTRFEIAYINILDSHRDRSTIICNGIRANYSRKNKDYNVIKISCNPKILVLDTDRQLEFNLTRSYAELGVDLEEKIYEELFKYFLAIVFINSPKLTTSDGSRSYVLLSPYKDDSYGDELRLNTNKTFSIIKITQKIKITIYARGKQSLILYTSKGILINDISLSIKLNVKKMLVVYLPILRFTRLGNCQVYDRKEHGTYFDQKCSEFSSKGFFKVNYFNLLAISDLQLGNDVISVDVIPTYPSKFTSLEGIQIWIYEKIVEYKKYYKNYIQSIKFICLTNIVSNHQEEKIKNNFNRFLDITRNKDKQQDSYQIEIINWIQGNLYIYIQGEQGLVTFCVGENLNTETNFQPLHTKIQELSQDPIYVNSYSYNHNYDNSYENFLSENLLKIDQGQENIQDIITVEISFNESLSMPENQDESIVKLWIQAFGEEVIPYKDTPEDKSKINSDNIPVLKEYIEELKKINF
ncbi:HD domain-containing protein [Anabaena azotica]|uniref:ATP-binding protein n=1 Tax=Anabaena azotica FACHB-119 TaxID=947527 RepID=A0ABR8D3L4_9NOST|nr:ATP-binding protein [Anabaena azotica]MBD2501749.1 ATP-binding protein [Anabaena azotica FACHB-119]